MKAVSTNFNGDWNDACPYCGEKQEKHKVVAVEFEGVRYEHRMPCEPEKLEITKQAQSQARTLKILGFIGWILVPFVIAVVGFTSVVVGLLLFIISLSKIGWTGLELFGKSQKWLPGYKSKREKERLMHHYYYHCEKNPDGFRTILIENLQTEEDV